MKRNKKVEHSFLHEEKGKKEAEPYLLFPPREPTPLIEREERSCADSPSLLPLITAHEKKEESITVNLQRRSGIERKEGGQLSWGRPQSVTLLKPPRARKRKRGGSMPNFPLRHMGRGSFRGRIRKTRTASTITTKKRKERGGRYRHQLSLIPSIPLTKEEKEKEETPQKKK